MLRFVYFIGSLFHKIVIATSFLPLSINMSVKIVGNSKLAMLGLIVICLFCGPATPWKTSPSLQQISANLNTVG